MTSSIAIYRRVHCIASATVTPDDVILRLEDYSPTSIGGLLVSGYLRQIPHKLSDRAAISNVLPRRPSQPPHGQVGLLHRSYQQQLLLLASASFHHMPPRS